MRLIIYVMLLLYPFSLLPAASGGKKEKNLSDEELMTLVQKQTFRYFWDYGHPVSGLARERSNGNDDIVTIGGSGFGVMAIIVGAERGFVTREQAAERMLKIVSFLNDKNTDISAHENAPVCPRRHNRRSFYRRQNDTFHYNGLQKGKQINFLRVCYDKLE